MPLPALSAWQKAYDARLGQIVTTPSLQQFVSHHVTRVGGHLSLPGGEDFAHQQVSRGGMTQIHRSPVKPGRFKSYETGFTREGGSLTVHILCKLLIEEKRVGHGDNNPVQGS
jgi:hypothetical protein